MVKQNGRKILITAGGLAGLGLAGFLRQKGMQATVVEKAPEWHRVGWGIGLWPNGLALLDKLGVGSAVRTAGTTAAKFEIRRADRSLLWSLKTGSEDLLVAVHRADLHEALRSRVPPEWIRMGTRASRLMRCGAGIEVEFEDQGADRFDFVVGADGIDSTVGECLFPERKVKPLQTVVWSFWGEKRAWEIGDEVVSIWAPGVEAFLVEIGDRLLVNIAARLSQDIEPNPPALDLLRNVAQKCGGALPELLAARDGEEDVFFDRVSEVEAGSWRCGQVLLIGDAAHALHPISGMGAALALEDAYVLADELERDVSVSDALTAFEVRRLKRVRTMKRLAHIEQQIAFTESPLLSRVRNLAIRSTPAFQWIFERRMKQFQRHPLSGL